MRQCLSDAWQVVDDNEHCFPLPLSNLKREMLLFEQLSNSPSKREMYSYLSLPCHLSWSLVSWKKTHSVIYSISKHNREFTRLLKVPSKTSNCKSGPSEPLTSSPCQGPTLTLCSFLLPLSWKVSPKKPGIRTGWSTPSFSVSAA